MGKMASGTPLTDEDRWPWLEILSVAIDQWLRAEQGVILGCSALKQSYRDILVSGRPGVQIVHLKGPKALIAQRLKDAAAPLHAGQPARQPICDPRRTARRTERGHRPSARSHCRDHPHRLAALIAIVPQRRFSSFYFGLFAPQDSRTIRGVSKVICRGVSCPSSCSNISSIAAWAIASRGVARVVSAGVI